MYLARSVSHIKIHQFKPTAFKSNATFTPLIRNLIVPPSKPTTVYTFAANSILNRKHFFTFKNRNGGTELTTKPIEQEPKVDDATMQIRKLLSFNPFTPFNYTFWKQLTETTPSYGTFLIAAICELLFLYYLSSDEETYLESMPARESDIWNGEWWRLITSTFAHAGFFHFIFNTTAWITFARIVELRIGTARLLGLALTTGLFGSASEFAFGMHNTRVEQNLLGISGSICGLLGFGYFGLRHMKYSEGLKNLTREGLLQSRKLSYAAFGTKGIAIRVSAFLLLTGWLLNQVQILSTGIAMWAHSGGFVSGALIGTALRFGGQPAAIATTIGLVGTSYAIATFPIWNSKYHAWKGSSLIRQGKFEEAIPYLEDSIALSKDNYDWPFALLALSLAVVNREEEAQEIAKLVSINNLITPSDYLKLLQTIKQARFNEKISVYNSEIRSKIIPKDSPLASFDLWGKKGQANSKSSSSSGSLQDTQAKLNQVHKEKKDLMDLITQFRNKQPWWCFDGEQVKLLFWNYFELGQRPTDLGEHLSELMQLPRERMKSKKAIH